MSFSPKTRLREEEEQRNRLRHEGRIDERRLVGERLRYWAAIYQDTGQPDVAVAFGELARKEFS